MKITVAIIVHDRIGNINRWIECWKQCEQHQAELVVIQNDCGSDAIKMLCLKNKIKYVARKNIGFDIGAFQDVCRERLKGFDNDWDVMLWCTDDIFPMSKDFLSPYLKMLPENGVICTDLSAYVKTHIRTTGFMITKGVSSKLKFDKDPILSKEDCYQFEHRSKTSFYEQMINLGFPVKQVASRETSPLWDSGYKRRLDRNKEQIKAFEPGRDAPSGLNDKENVQAAEDKRPGRTKKVAFICPAYNNYPQIISSILTQTHTNWELFVIHDGPNATGLKKHVKDSRIKYMETPAHVGKWGHSLRKWALENIDTLCPDADYVVITNADNYHVPVYTEYMLRGFEKNPTAVATYCSDMVHSYKAWQIIPCRLQLGYIDCAGVMIKKEVAKEIGWRDTESHSSDWSYFNDIIKKYGADKWQKVTGCLLIHN